MSEKKLIKDEKLSREQVIGTNGEVVWVPTVDIGGTNKAMSSKEKMVALGWTYEELAQTAKFAPRAPRIIGADGKERGAYRFANGCSYRGFGSMYDALEAVEERARHNKNSTSVTTQAPATINWNAVALLEFVPEDKREAAMDKMDLDENTKMYAKTLGHLRELKADKKIEKVFEDFAKLFVK